MINCDEKLNTLLKDMRNAKEYLSKLRRGEIDNIFNIDNFQNYQPYLVSEEVLINFLDMAQKYKQYKELLKEIAGFIVIKENVTDKVFDELLNMAKSGNDWLFLHLCHANLSKEKQKILKDLNLPKALWY